MADEQINPEFYWQTARDYLLTEKALLMFQIAMRHHGEDFDQAKIAIDSEYERAVNRAPGQRHGGNFQSFVQSFQEVGWLTIDTAGEQRILSVTPLGRQAEQLLIKTPDFLKAVPYFLVELLARFQLNNPTRPTEVRNPQIREATARSNVFPYWTIWKIMRSCSNYITSDEFRRFVLRIHRTEEIEPTIERIRAFRRDIERGLPEEELNAQYPEPLGGARGETRYFMERAGIYIGKHPSLITKPNASTFALNPAYLPLIDEVLTQEPLFKEVIDRNTWIQDYGQPLVVEAAYIPFSVPEDDPEAELDYERLPDTDLIWQRVQELLALNIRNILFTGPPGTSKTTYALLIGAKLANYRPYRFHNVQFHQSLGYEDFMAGYVPNDDTNGANFIQKRKTFLRACDRAGQDNSDTYHVLVIDEFNRGDPSRILGDAQTYIERRDVPFEISNLRDRAMVPNNLVILATMNPYDKSIADLDQAMERRFSKIVMDPDSMILRRILEQNGAPDDLIKKLIGLFNSLNRGLENRIGQAYFKNVKDLATLRTVWRHDLLPLLHRELARDKQGREVIEKKFHDDFPDVPGDNVALHNILTDPAQIDDAAPLAPAQDTDQPDKVE